MIKNITIGQYIPGDSFIHKLDPRTKILVTLLLIIAIFLMTKFISFVFVVIFLLLIMMIAKIKPSYVLKGLKTLIIILSLTFILNIFVVPGETLFHLGPFTATKEGFRVGLFMVIRLVLLVIGTSLLTLTTSPIALTDGIESLLKPLKKIGVPAHELAMMMTIALRFIPTLLEETEKIMKAQMGRGADFESGNLFNRAKNMLPILVPLFIMAFRRADELAIAMEARCYRGGEGRTKLKQLSYQGRDAVAFLMTFLILGAGVSLRWIL